MILLSMLSGLAVMSQDGETLGRVRERHNTDYGCDRYNYYEDRDLNKKNNYHIGQILNWLYVILFASNVLVVLCLVQLIAFLAVWVLEMIVVCIPILNLCLACPIKRLHLHYVYRYWEIPCYGNLIPSVFLRAMVSDFDSEQDTRLLPSLRKVCLWRGCRQLILGKS